MGNFPLGERNIVNDGIPVFKDIPDGLTEYKHSCPRQATGSGGRRATYCVRCKGWVSGEPAMQNRTQHAMPFVAADFNTTIFRCRRCGHPLDAGPVGGTEQSNDSGIGTEGGLRPPRQN
jgi:hypothetical protein